MTHTLTQTGKINETRLALHRPCVRARPDVVQLDAHHVPLDHPPHVALAEHTPVNLPVIHETLVAPLPVLIVFVLAREMLEVVAVARV